MSPSSPSPLAAWWLAAFLAALASAAAATELWTSSRWIVDEGGKRVKLACVNWPSHMEPMVTEGLSKRPVGGIAGDVAAMGFNCVRLTYPTFLVTDAANANLTVAQSFQRLNLTEALDGIRTNNPGIVDLKLIDAYKTVVSSLGEHKVMVILDNHVSKPGWCCGPSDGNGFFGDAFFDPDVWVDGLTKMATTFAGAPNVVGMSLRNELRGARQNANDWYKYMQRGAEAVHAANPRALVILSGLQYDNDLSFLNSRPVNLSFTGKAAFELHWYSFTNPGDWSSGNANDVCGRLTAGVTGHALYLLDKGWPVVLSEFGVDNRGVNDNDNRFWGCVAAAAVDADLDWALWTLQGSYYLRDGQRDPDEVYGVLDRAWAGPRNQTALRRVQALQRPFRGPGLAEAAAPYTVLFHAATGTCVVVVARGALELGPCDETGAWAYSAREQRLALRDAGGGTGLTCLRAEGAGRPAGLGATCSDAMARWRLVSDSKLHVAVNASSSSSSLGNGGLLCLDVGADGRSVVTNPCRCLSGDHACDPGSQWFKLVTSTRSVATKTMLAQLPLKLKNGNIKSL